MNCPTCGAELEIGQKFCIQCGANVAPISLPVPPAGPLPTAPPTVPIAVPPPAAPNTHPAPDAFAPPTQALTPPPGPTKAFAIVEQTVHQSPPISDQVPQWAGGWATPAAMATALGVAGPAHTAPTPAARTLLDEPTGTLAVGGPTTQAVPYPAGYAPTAAARIGRGSVALAVLAGLAAVATVVAAFVPILRVRTDAPIVDVGVYKSNDLYLGTNLLIGLVVAAACLIGGSVLALLGRRIGAGLVAGAGLSLAPVAVIVYGSVDTISRRAEANAFEAAASGAGGTFFQTRLEAGLWLLVGAAALGLVAVVVSLLQAGSDGRARLNTGVGVAGALAAVTAAVGQMIPGDYTTFADNFNAKVGSHTVAGGRVALIAIVALSGVIGFLRANRWGIGFALGGTAIWTWQWVSSLAKLGDTPLPPGFAPFGSNGELQPHLVTTIGVVGVLVFAAIALLTPQRRR